jgi:hypothetical protein
MRDELLTGQPADETPPSTNGRRDRLHAVEAELRETRKLVEQLHGALESAARAMLDVLTVRE